MHMSVFLLELDGDLWPVRLHALYFLDGSLASCRFGLLIVICCPAHFELKSRIKNHISRTSTQVELSVVFLDSEGRSADTNFPQRFDSPVLYLL